MNRACASIFILSIAVAGVSCQPSEPETTPAPDTPAADVAPPTESAAANQPGVDADPVVVDPDHYSVAAENDRVRVLRIRYGPGETSVMHDHPDGVVIALTDHDVSFELPDGSSEVVTAEAGSAAFAAGGPHLPTNRAEDPVEVVLVELKPASEPAGEDSAAQTGADPVEVDADHYALEFENERVRVLRINYGPGESSVMHYHPETVAVILTHHEVSFEFPDGSSEDLVAEPGDVALIPAGSHLPTNRGEEPFEVIAVELK